MEQQDEQEQGTEPLVSAAERQDFLNRQGWKRATKEERQRLEEEWTDAKIHMAIEMNLA